MQQVDIQIVGLEATQARLERRADGSRIEIGGAIGGVAELGTEDDVLADGLERLAEDADGDAGGA